MKMIRTSIVKEGAHIHGGAFRLDKGPTHSETMAFRHAICLYDECRREGKAVTLGCIVNDLGLSPDKRPKATGNFLFPQEYLQLLQEARIPLPEIYIVYESTLRNRARKDNVRTLKLNEERGIPVAICANIMGRFYKALEKQGIPQVIGFYTLGEKGPLRGTVPRISGYTLSIEVINFTVLSDGSLITLSVPDGSCRIAVDGGI